MPNKESKLNTVLEKMGMVKKQYIEDGEDAFQPESDLTDFDLDSSIDTAEFEFDDIPEPDLEPDPEPVLPPQAAAAPPPQTAYGLDKAFWNDTLAADEDDPANRYLDVEQLYRHFRMKSVGTDTIYLIEDYIKTLPDSLPIEMRRSIVLKIVQSSGFDFDVLLNDGIERVAKLNDYSTEFAGRTEEIVSHHSAEIVQLEQQIERIREIISERRNLHKRQFLTIENEAQRLKDILDFVTK